MDRREFLKLLGIASVAPVYFFAPRGGWLRSSRFSGGFDLGSSPGAAFPTLELYRSTAEVERDFGPGDNPEYDAVNSYFRIRRLQPGDYVGSPFDVGEPFALYDQNGMRIGKGHLVPLGRPTDPVLRLDRGPYRADLVLKKGVVLPKASELSIGYEVGSSRRLV
jgi:hypothetical protein